MDAKDIRNLSEAYLEVYNELDEGYKELPVDKMIAKSKSLARIPREPGAPRWDRNAQRGSDIRKTAGTHSRAKVKKVEKANRERGTQREEYDLYDIILSHLLDEGYAETPEAAQVIMVNMSEDWREEIMEGMTMKDFKANRRKLKRREDSADAVKRGHVGKEWYNSGRKYSPDEAKRSRAKMDDEERRTRHRTAVDPDNEDDNNYSADKTKNLKKLRKQRAMGEH